MKFLQDLLGITLLYNQVMETRVEIHVISIKLTQLEEQIQSLDINDNLNRAEDIANNLKKVNQMLLELKGLTSMIRAVVPYAKNGQVVPGKK